HVLQHVELAQRLSASSEGMSATAATHPGIRFNYGSRIVANHEQGREIQILTCPKSELISDSYIAPCAKILKKKSLLNSSRGS
ncbi:MAG TPA: hypothetical protein VGJ73_09700, partial [Verrucomicrobiae bacterium]